VSETSNPATLSTPPAAFPTSDAEIIEQLKRQLHSTERQLSTTEQHLQYAELKIRVLEERLRVHRIAKYGPGSEKLSNEQLELLELEPGVSNQEVEAESQREPLPAAPRRRRHPGRQTLSPDLPRVERVIACTAEQCVCDNCGCATTGRQIPGSGGSGLES